jgi:DNA-binding transcriptional ArsR family regulator
MEWTEPPTSAFEALSNVRRCEILWHLAKHPRTVSELCQLTEQNQPVVSKHLRVLRTAGLVNDRTVRRDKRMRLYAVDRKGMVELENWLGDLRVTWDTSVPHTPIRNSPFQPDPLELRTTRGTLRVRRRFFWRKEDAVLAASMGPEWTEAQLRKITRQARVIIERQLRREGGF